MKEEYIKTYKWMNALRGGVLRDVYALIYQIGKRGVVSISIEYICDRMGYSARNVQRAITELKEMGWIEVEYTKGKRSVFKALTPDKMSPQTPDNLSSPDPRQFDTPDNLTPPTICRNTPDNLTPPTPYISSDKDLDYSSSSSCAYARERLKKWIVESDIKKWAERMLARGKFSMEVEVILDDFYDNDFSVREECERSERTAVLKHFQNWLPKYLRKLKTENDNEYQPRNPQSGYNAPADTAQRKPYSRVQELANAKFDIE